MKIWETPGGLGPWWHQLRGHVVVNVNTHPRTRSLGKFWKCSCGKAWAPWVQ